ncbi:cold shock and DUF1294 domain-containing protein [Ideonella sp. DXS22W]|uniref:Cold shock and DUF1294 domain-containing protein n=1 Tax=Pseudaquabacterium inlustre TaxID=2984192 RepID=A0ABU9CEL5_9BURK
MRFEGTLTRWDDARGFGYLESTQGGEPIWVHIRAISGLDGRPRLGQRFSFEVEPGQQGKKRAARVTPLRSSAPPPRARRSEAAAFGTASLFVLPAFVVLALAVAYVWRPPFWLGWLYLGASLAAFASYAVDKSAAERQAWRVRESTLHGLSLIGGWPGALLAQQLLRHKTVKREFRTMFWLTVALNVTAFVAGSVWLARQNAG